MKEITLPPIRNFGSDTAQEIKPQMAVEHKTDRPVVEKQSSEPAPAKEKLTPSKGYAMGDVVLKFKVDDQTKDLTVFVVDKESKKVIRTIPAEELRKLDAGDLVEILA